MRSVEDSGDTKQRTYSKVAKRPCFLLLVPVLIVVALWGTHVTVFRDFWLVHEADWSRALVGSVYDFLRRMVRRDDPLCLQWGMDNR